MPHPQPGVDYPESWRELLAWFPDEAACLAYLERLRWHDGLVCPACGGVGGWRMGDGEEGRARIHPPPRGGRPHGRVDAGALPSPARGQAFPQTQNGMPFTLPFSPDTVRWRRAAIVELRKLGIQL